MGWDGCRPPGFQEHLSKRRWLVLFATTIVPYGYMPVGTILGTLRRHAFPTSPGREIDWLAAGNRVTPGHPSLARAALSLSLSLSLSYPPDLAAEEKWHSSMESIHPRR
ncbi:hypothetical protein LZ31DRAFT_217885 [Colletotrichum somersetense]|nr:hypothetical protein LZ31DRAFT_217885 [Colletotrichum somersetense]